VWRALAWLLGVREDFPIVRVLAGEPGTRHTAPTPSATGSTTPLASASNGFRSWPAKLSNVLLHQPVPGRRLDAVLADFGIAGDAAGFGAPRR
jgi:hypothetical protein